MSLAVCPECGEANVEGFSPAEVRALLLVEAPGRFALDDEPRTILDDSPWMYECNECGFTADSPLAFLAQERSGG